LQNRPVHSQEVSTRELIAYLMGEMTCSDAKLLERRLARSVELSRRLSDLEKMLDRLRSDDASVAPTDLVADVRRAIEQSKARPTKSRWPAPRPAWLAPALALGIGAVAVVGLLVSPAERTVTPSDRPAMQARSAAVRLYDADRWVALHAFRVTADGRPSALDASLRQHEGLAFAYTNLGRHPQSYLMVFAVDSQRQAYWFYPAYTDGHSNPRSIAIEPSQERTELPEVVRHHYHIGAARLYAVFSRTPLWVGDVEEMLHTQSLGPPLPERLPLPNTAQDSIAIEVTP